jgi:hypothetical protein
MQNHTDSREKIDKKLQQPSHVFDDPVTCYVEVLSVKNCIHWSKMNLKMSMFSNPKKLKNVHMIVVKKMKKVLNQVKEPFHCVFLLSNC